MRDGYSKIALHDSQIKNFAELVQLSETRKKCGNTTIAGRINDKNE